MIYHVRFEGAFSSASNRNAVRTDTTSSIGTRPRATVAGELMPTSVDLSRKITNGANGLKFNVYFQTATDRNAVAARLESFASGSRAPRSGSKLFVHDCRDDEDLGPCTLTTRRAW